MSKIYTKTGDQGETGLIGGDRVKKCSLQIAAYGEVDELSTFIGASRNLSDGEIAEVLKTIQKNLFQIGRQLATPHSGQLSEGSGVSKQGVAWLEEKIDQFEKELPPLKKFILPGGSALAVSFHQARTVCRRAEREIVSLMNEEKVDKEILAYMNRLSDFLFVLARWGNFKEGSQEIEWEGK